MMSFTCDLCGNDQYTTSYGMYRYRVMVVIDPHDEYSDPHLNYCPRCADKTFTNRPSVIGAVRLDLHPDDWRKLLARRRKMNKSKETTP